MGETGWREVYERRRMTAVDALRRLRSGARVFVGAGCGRPAALVEELARAVTRLWDVEVLVGRTFGEPIVVGADADGRCRPNAFHVGSDLYAAVAGCRADYTPVRSSEVAALFAEGIIPLDVALVQVRPPDADGRCCLGVSVGLVHAAVERARYVIAEVNPRVPRTHGDTLVPVDRFDAFVEVDRPLQTALRPVADETARRIAEHAARLIPDGATLRLGHNAIAAALVERLIAEGRRDLGLHAELFTEDMMELMRAGVATNARKTVDPGKAVACRCVGGPRLFEFVDDNPAVELRGEAEVSCVARVAAQERMVAVARVAQVDLTGQVADEFAGLQQGGGAGARDDFLRGAAASPGGRPIVALASTTPDGAESNVRLFLDPGAGVAAGRSDVHWVVTEWGAASLRGRSVRDRVLALIEVAAPPFRDGLLAAARERGYVPRDQVRLASDPAAYPRGLERATRLPDGREAFFRPVRPGDERMVRTFLYGLSERSVYHRFHSEMRRMEESAVREFVAIDYRGTMTIVALLGDSAESVQMIGMGQYVRCREPETAELAFVVADEHHGCGVATWMLQRLVEHGRGCGIRRFVGEVLVGNPAMLRVLEKGGVPCRRSFADGVHLVELVLEGEEP